MENSVGTPTNDKALLIREMALGRSGPKKYLLAYEGQNSPCTPLHKGFQTANPTTINYVTRMALKKTIEHQQSLANERKCIGWQAITRLFVPKMKGVDHDQWYRNWLKHMILSQYCTFWQSNAQTKAVSLVVHAVVSSQRVKQA